MDGDSQSKRDLGTLPQRHKIRQRTVCWPRMSTCTDPSIHHYQVLQAVKMGCFIWWSVNWVTLRNRRKTDQGKPANVRKRREGNRRNTNWNRIGMACTQATRKGFHQRCTNRAKEEEKMEEVGNWRRVTESWGRLKTASQLGKSNSRLMHSREDSSNDLISRMPPAKHTNFKHMLRSAWRKSSKTKSSSTSPTAQDSDFSSFYIPEIS